MVTRHTIFGYLVRPKLMHFHTQSFPHLTLPSISCGPRVSAYKEKAFRRSSLKCCLSTLASPPSSISHIDNDKPLPAEVSRTIMELSTVGTLSTMAQEGWPIGVGVRFAVDGDGTPIFSLGELHRPLSVDTKSSLHIQLDQCGMRTPQCTILGSLSKLEDNNIVKCRNLWMKRFGQTADENLLYAVTVERVLQMDNFMEDGVWITSSEFKNATPDPLRNCAEAIINEINENNVEDVLRFCNVYVDVDFQVSEAKLIWVDRLGFDMRLSSPQNGVFDVRIPFPREVADEKGAKSSFNSLSQLAWEVEKNYQVQKFQKVKQLKRISYG